MIRRFTGWHMAAILISFFGVEIAVNFVMARDAVRTFGGEVVENSYVASQHYNRWLAEAGAQERAGWKAQPSIDARGHLTAAIHQAGAVIADARVIVIARHPLGRVPDRRISLTWNPALGRYVSATPLPHGRWLLRIEVDAPGAKARFEDEVRA